MRLVFTRTLWLLCVIGCIDHRSERARAPATSAGTDELGVTADCLALAPPEELRAGELVMVFGRESDAELELTDLVIAVNGQQRKLPSDAARFVFFREVVPAGQYTLQAVARVQGSAGSQSEGFQLPLSHAVQTDGTRALCVEMHLSFVSDATSRLKRRPQLRASDWASAE